MIIEQEKNPKKRKNYFRLSQEAKELETKSHCEYGIKQISQGGFNQPSRSIPPIAYTLDWFYSH